MAENWLLKMSSDERKIFYLGLDESDMPASILRRLSRTFKVYPLSKAKERDETQARFTRVNALAGEVFEMEIYYSDYAVKYRATRNNSGWRVEQVGGVLTW